MAAENKIVLNISDAPTWTKVTPFIGAAAGIGLAKFQGKECVWCFVGYALTGLLICSIPLVYKSKE